MSWIFQWLIELDNKTFLGISLARCLVDRAISCFATILLGVPQYHNIPGTRILYYWSKFLMGLFISSDWCMFVQNQTEFETNQQCMETIYYLTNIESLMSREKNEKSPRCNPFRKISTTYLIRHDLLRKPIRYLQEPGL
jgi:hypothetical protein